MFDSKSIFSSTGITLTESFVSRAVVWFCSYRVFLTFTEANQSTQPSNHHRTAANCSQLRKLQQWPWDMIDRCPVFSGEILEIWTTIVWTGLELKGLRIIIKKGRLDLWALNVGVFFIGKRRIINLARAFENDVFVAKTDKLCSPSTWSTFSKRLRQR